MNHKIHLLLLIVCFSLSFFSISCSSSKKTNTTVSQEEIMQAISNDNWIFSADQALPTYGRSRFLTGGYEVICHKDTLIVALPYYGKLNSPTGANNSNPLDFKTTKIILNKEVKKEGERLVSIKPNNTEVQSMTFTFFDNGSAQLNIIMTNRSGISFSGKVVPAK